MFSGRIDISGLRRRFKIVRRQKISANNVTVAPDGDVNRVIALAEDLQAELIGNAVVHVDFNGNVFNFVLDNGRIFKRNNDPENECDENRKNDKKFCVGKELS